MRFFSDHSHPPSVQYPPREAACLRVRTSGSPLGRTPDSTLQGLAQGPPFFSRPKAPLFQPMSFFLARECPVDPHGLYNISRRPVGSGGRPAIPHFPASTQPPSRQRLPPPWSRFLESFDRGPQHHLFESVTARSRPHLAAAANPEARGWAQAALEPMARGRSARRDGGQRNEGGGGPGFASNPPRNIPAIVIRDDVRLATLGLLSLSESHPS